MTIPFGVLNFVFFIIGMIGVGITTHWSAWALFWAFIASIHITLTIKS